MWEEKDNITIDRNIPCVIYTYMPRKRLEKKKYSASKDEVATEPASELSYYERGDTEVVELELVYFIDDYKNDEDEGIFESPPSKKRIGGIGRA